MELPYQPPANDNGIPEVIPLFVALIQRHDLTRTDVIVYGTLAAYAFRGAVPPMRELAPLLGMSVRRLSERFRRLEDCGLVVRSGHTTHGTLQRYELLGPKLTG